MDKGTGQIVLNKLNINPSIFNPVRQVPIPHTTPGHYITGIPALNLPAPEGTSGDWHFYAVYYDTVDNNGGTSVVLQLAGDGEVLNTNNIYGRYGIYECSAAMKKYGLIIPNRKAYAANHFRAILDMLYWSLIRYHKVIGLIGATEDWLDTNEQKDFLLKKAEKMLPFLCRKTEQIELQNWIDRERLPGYRG